MKNEEKGSVGRTLRFTAIKLSLGEHIGSPLQHQCH